MKWIAANVYFKKEEILQVDNLTFHLKIVEKEEQNDHREVKRRKQ